MYSLKEIFLKKEIIELNPVENKIDSIIGINIKFKPINENEIYFTSYNKIVQFFPYELSSKGINLDIKSVIKLQTLFLQVISTYLYSLRKNVDLSNITIKSKLDENRFLKVKIDPNFFREKNKGRYKIYISIYVKEDKENNIPEYEEITFPLTKRDVLIFYGLIKKILQKYNKIGSFFIDAHKIKRPDTNIFLEENEIIEYYKNEENIIVKDIFIGITKVENSILLDKMWLHGQEILNLMYIAYKLIYGFEIEKNLSAVHLNYRQIQTITQNGIVYLIVKKMNFEHKEEPVIDNETNQEYYLKIPISANFLTLIDNLINMEVLKNSDMSLLESNYITETNNPFFNSDKKSIKKNIPIYHISLKESWLGVSLTEKEKNNEKEKIINFIGLVKDGAYKIIDDEGNILENSYIKDNQIYSNILNNFKIKLTPKKARKIIKGLAIALNKDYILNKNNNKNYKKTTLITAFDYTHEGKIKYEIKIKSIRKNKAPAILTINKYRLHRKDSNSKNEYEEELLESFRQPLFERYIFMLIHIFLSITEMIEEIELIEVLSKNDILKIEYKSLKKVELLDKYANQKIGYGIKKEGENTFWGAFKVKEKNNRYEFKRIKNSTKGDKPLSLEEKCLLNESSYSRIIRGYWIPFVGNIIAIGPDRYITDMYGEINMQKVGSSNSFIEYDWAINLYFGTNC